MYENKFPLEAVAPVGGAISVTDIVDSDKVVEASKVNVIRELTWVNEQAFV